MWYAYAPSPIGDLLLVGVEEGLLQIHMRRALPPADAENDERRFARVMRQLDEYFDGKRKTFDLPLAMRGTPFQLDVWRALQRIPYGETRTYAGIANEIGRPRATRAVGAANGANPIPIVVPCHRVIGTNGSLTGFGGGIDVKRRLLEMEAGVPTLF
jgi:methylated-DNA-[protein]-cysteine S-methyltransferase